MKTLVVLECPAALTKKNVSSLRKRAKAKFGKGYKIVVIGGGLKVQVFPHDKAT